MQPGEVIVARLKGGPAIGRYAPAGRESGRGDRVRISVGRNREAQLPADRVVLATGFVPNNDEELEEFRRRCDALAAGIDLRDVWELARDDATPLSLDDLSELYWGTSPELAKKVATLLHVSANSLYFLDGEEGFTARTQENVQETLSRLHREEENAREAESLMQHLSQGILPPEMAGHQSALLQHLRGFAVHGENYTRAATATGLLHMVDSGTRDLQRLSFELLVDVGVFSPDEPLELERADIVEDFPEDALAEAAAVDLSAVLEESGRRDLTGLPAVTIDDAGTEDRDDALSLEIEGRETGDGAVYRVGVHIADAGALIQAGGALDREADRRMATMYLPERKVPMLPPDLSVRKGSLVPGESRATLSLLASISDSGDILDWEVVPSVIRSQAALSYEEADRAIDEATHHWHQMMASLNGLGELLRSGRERAGAINVERPEMMIRVPESSDIQVRVVARSSPARRLVTEFMVLCNSLLAELCRREGVPAAYRSQVVPDPSEVEAVSPDGPFGRFLMTRHLPPAELSLSAEPHAGLGVQAYIQATSPIRRYPDLVMQRQISHVLASGEPLYSPETVASVAQRADVQVRELAAIEEERNRYWFLKYLKQCLTESQGDEEPGVFQAVVLDRRPRRTSLLELADYPFRFRAELPDLCAPGDTVTVRLHGVDLWRRVGQFVHIPDG